MGFGLLAGAQRRLFCIFARMILVTGGTGLVGGHLLYRFRESETPIIAIYRTEDSIKKTRTIFESYGAGNARFVDQFTWIQADLLDIPSLEDAMQGVTRVYHCAAALGGMSFEKMTTINVTGTEKLINIAIENQIEKFCYVSSIAALGNPIGNQSITEEDFFNPDAVNTDYAITKYTAEMEVWRASQEGLKVVIVNPGVILGEGNYDDGSGQLFSKMAGWQSFYTSGSTGIVDVRDVTCAMELLMESTIYNERFILIAENMSYKNLLDTIAEYLNVSKPNILLPKWLLYILYSFSLIPRFLGASKGLTRAQIVILTSSTIYDNSKYVNTLEFNYQNMADSIQRIAAHYRKK